ncbi:MAG: tRNA 4-thiouridine(8) synthase ThiI, partial [Planctomycetes bacterium]|nr:tRNA 4-thiouridine(8) synthase ThiI [Planctomycetota bacterium]
EAVTLARRIGTLELSSRPEPDCCTIFQPRAPVIFGQVEDCEFAESKLPMESLLRDALDRTRVQVLDPNE